MKKIILTVVCLSIYMMNVNSQTSLGVKGGLNISNLFGDETENFSVRTSVHFVAMVEFHINEKFSIQPEFVYSAQGVKESLDSYYGHWHLNYLYVPVIAKYYVIDNLSLEGGPQIGYLVNAKLDWEDSDDSGLEDLDHITSSIDFGLNFGLGYKLDSGIHFGARYYLGFINVFDDYIEIDTAKNGVFQFSLGYFFN